MRAVGIRELRQQASRYLREVERGESFEVTDRGRPVARLVPLEPSSSIEALARTGRLVPAGADALELGAPLEPAQGPPLPSVELERNRADER